MHFVSQSIGHLITNRDDERVYDEGGRIIGTRQFNCSNLNGEQLPPGGLTSW